MRLVFVSETLDFLSFVGPSFFLDLAKSALSSWLLFHFCQRAMDAGCAKWAWSAALLALSNGRTSSAFSSNQSGFFLLEYPKSFLEEFCSTSTSGWVFVSVVGSSSNSLCMLSLRAHLVLMLPSAATQSQRFFFPFSSFLQVVREQFEGCYGQACGLSNIRLQITWAMHVHLGCLDDRRRQSRRCQFLD